MFEETKNAHNSLDATEAIRALNRRDKVKIVYDPDDAMMEKANRKISDTGLMPKEENKDEDDDPSIDMGEPPLIGKAKSMALPFSHLSGGAGAA